MITLWASYISLIKLLYHKEKYSIKLKLLDMQTFLHFGLVRRKEKSKIKLLLMHSQLGFTQYQY